MTLINSIELKLTRTLVFIENKYSGAGIDSLCVDVVNYWKQKAD